MKFVKVTIIVIIFTIYLSILSFNIFSSNKNIFGYTIYQIASESMDGNVDDYKIDSLEAGDYVIVKLNYKKSFYNDLEVGDVITFKMNQGPMIGSIVTHRISEIRYDEYLDTFTITTLGDKNDETNVEILNSKVDKIYGEVILANDFINFIFPIVTHYIFLIFGILLPTILFLFHEISQLLKYLFKIKY